MWNYEIYSDESGPAVDFLGQYERLEQDLRKVLRHVGIKEPIDIPRTNITGTRPEQHDYRDFYTPRTRALVADWYAREIALLGYGF
jgi:hypothetical protein